MFKALMRKREAGFTLVELMIVVAIIGVLAALAIYGVSRYLKHSKTAEASRNLGSIETGSKAQYQLDTDISSSKDGSLFGHIFCPSSSASVPAAVPVGAKVKSTIAEWATPTWECLKFSIGEPQFYAYSYSASGVGTAAGYTATANGDLDGNGSLSTFQLIGEGSTTGDARRKQLNVVNEDE